MTVHHLTLPPADARSDEILALARIAFVEKGFDGASMQDLARAAGMSAGNFYRYFPSKSALVEAMINRDIDEVQQHFNAIVSTNDPIAALRQTLLGRLDQDLCGDESPLWAEIMAAAARKPEIAAILARMENQVANLITRVIGLACHLPAEEAARRYGAHARMIILLVRGASLESAQHPQMQSDLKDLIMRTIDKLIGDIVTENAGA